MIGLLSEAVLNRRSAGAWAGGRMEAEIGPVRLDPDSQAWLVTRHADCVSVLRAVVSSTGVPSGQSELNDEPNLEESAGQSGT